MQIKNLSDLVHAETLCQKVAPSRSPQPGIEMAPPPRSCAPALPLLPLAPPPNLPPHQPVSLQGHLHSQLKERRPRPAPEPPVPPSLLNAFPSTSRRGLGALAQQSLCSSLRRRTVSSTRPRPLNAGILSECTKIGMNSKPSISTQFDPRHTMNDADYCTSQHRRTSRSDLRGNFLLTWPQRVRMKILQYAIDTNLTILREIPMFLPASFSPSIVDHSRNPRGDQYRRPTQYRRPIR